MDLQSQQMIIGFNLAIGFSIEAIVTNYSSRNKFELLGILLLSIFLFSHSMSENEVILESKQNPRKTSQIKMREEISILAETAGKE